MLIIASKDRYGSPLENCTGAFGAQNGWGCSAGENISPSSLSLSSATNPPLRELLPVAPWSPFPSKRAAILSAYLSAERETRTLRACWFTNGSPALRAFASALDAPAASAYLSVITSYFSVTSAITAMRGRGGLRGGSGGSVGVCTFTCAQTSLTRSLSAAVFRSSPRTASTAQPCRNTNPLPEVERSVKSFELPSSVLSSCLSTADFSENSRRVHSTFAAKGDARS
mmetsp:Transcript_6632/g.17270  ORF Transcript_6632/g.17270 Transcript_6632/m.17270 type:complete len:227 (-) Transcript_6632:914-1594(-)